MEVRCEPAIFVKAKLLDASHATLHLTRLDQIYNFYHPSILFYEGSCSTKQLLECNVEKIHVEEDKKSPNTKSDDAAALRAVRHGVEAMVEHYPWAAGRLHTVKKIHASQYGEEEHEFLEVCINEDGGPGVQLVGAYVNCPLHSLGDLSDPNPAFKPLFANVDENAPYHSRPLVALQVSRFECGGFSVSMCSNHVLFDGCAASLFLQNMGSCARGRGLCLPLDLAPRELRIHPHNVPPSPNLCFTLKVAYKKDLKPLTVLQASFSTPLVATKFVFTEHDLAKLKSHALSNQEDCKRGFQECSRFLVITAHLWKAKARCMMALYEDPSHEFTLHIPVNVRERVVASIPKNYAGNAFTLATPSASLKDLNEKSLAFVVEIIQDAMQQSSHLFQSNIDHLEILGGNACVTPRYMLAVSLANLGFYDIDFGWGKPTYFGRHFKQARNRVIIMDGNAESTSLNVYAAFISKDELLIFQDALKWEFAH